MLSVETEDAFHQALPLGLPIEVSPEIADGIVLMVEDVGTVEEIIAARAGPSAFRRTIRDLIEGCLGSVAEKGEMTR